MRISAQRRAQNETRIRAAMDRLLTGDIPAGGRCDITTLASEAAVDRTAFYGARPYAHLRAEFDARLAQATRAGQGPDPRYAQVSRLRSEAAALNKRLAEREQTIAELSDFKNRALSRLAAQHDEITQLRLTLAHPGNIRHLTARPDRSQPIT